MEKFEKILYKFRGSYIQTIFDYVQTHALYGIRKDDALEAKRLLKEAGASSFRVVNNDFGLVIVCFKMKKGN